MSRKEKVYRQSQQRRVLEAEREGYTLPSRTYQAIADGTVEVQKEERQDK